jgi:integrase
MARSAAEVKLDTATARRKLPARHEPYWNAIQPGLHIGYRRSATQAVGVWYARFTVRKGEALNSKSKLFKRLGIADDNGLATSVTALNYTQAQRAASDWLPEATGIATGEKPQNGGYTVSQALDDYLREHMEKRKAKSLTVTRYMANANIRPSLGSVAVDKLKKRQIELWHKDLAETRRRKPRGGENPDSPEAKRRRKDTANRNLTVLKAALTYALSEKRISCDGSAWRLVAPFKGVAQPRTRFLSDAEARSLVKNCPEPAFRLLIQAALYTGCRYSELGRLLVRDVGAGDTIFIAESKGYKPRTVFVGPEGGRFFRATRRGKQPGDFLLVTAEGGSWAKDRARGMMALACEAAGIEFLTIQELRHTTASRWIRQGLTLLEVAAQLGHSDTRMVSRHYGHLCENTLARRMRALPSIGFRKSNGKS